MAQQKPGISAQMLSCLIQKFALSRPSSGDFIKIRHGPFRLLLARNVWQVLLGDHSTEAATAAPGPSGRRWPGALRQRSTAEPLCCPPSLNPRNQTRRRPRKIRRSSFLIKRWTSSASRSQRRSPTTTWSRSVKSSTVSAIYAIWWQGRATGRPTGAVALVNAARERAPSTW